MRNSIYSVRVNHLYHKISFPDTVSLDPRRNLLFRKLITLHNTGNMKTIIYEISFDETACSGHGFTTPVCGNIEIESNEKYNLRIVYVVKISRFDLNEIHYFCA